MKLRKSMLAWFLLLAFAALPGCTGSGTGDAPASNPGGETSEQSSSPDEEKIKGDFAASTAEHDTDVGLKNIKIDTAELSLTEEQKAVLEFFDDDYLDVPSYEFLRRYPKVFEGAQLTVRGSVKKVISMDADSYELALWVDVVRDEWESADLEGHGGEYVLLKGKTGDAWFMEGDTLKIYGRYMGVETIEIDGTSYTIPVISAHNELIDPSNAPKWIYSYVEKFDLNDVKAVANAVFGGDIEIRRPMVGTDVTDEQMEIWQEVCGGVPCYVVELENQSNAKFSKYFFYVDSNISAHGGLRIADAKDAMGTSTIERNLEFSADFDHFFLFTYDADLENLKLEYYDHDLNKIWDREFPQTTSALYDYTKNNIYLVANNELYIINIETGEDTFAPSYVGEKVALRKLHDGILMISAHKSDGVMKCDLDGSIIWKTNLENDVYVAEGLQTVGSSIVFQYYWFDGNGGNGTRYVVLDNESGNITVDAVPIG